ncbi:MAG: methyltransferase domain-containing protein [Myxococcota bacterium]|nr:methyltransferase domain-containing protein [Myxococcota bacterium]
MRGIDFFREFLRDPTQTGAVMPSGQQLCRLLAQTAGVPEAKVVLEFGTGTGVVTREIARQLPGDGRFIGIEINPEMAKATQALCSDVEVVNRNAADAPEILRERGFRSCDCIVSGLPWASFPEALQDELLQGAVTALRPGGRFVTFAYLHALPTPAAKRFREKLGHYFAAVGKTSAVWANVPPALVYWADKDRG